MSTMASKLVKVVVALVLIGLAWKLLTGEEMTESAEEVDRID
jgi:hypothetical protein